MSFDERTHRVLASERRAGLLELLRTAGRPLSAAEAAEAIGLHPSTARLHLDLLASVGLVDRAAERRTTVGRPTIRYTAREAVDRPTGEGYERLARVLADGIAGSADPAAAARDAGRRWIETLELTVDERPHGPDSAIDEVVTLMDRLGFDPVRPSGEDLIELHRCPFEAVARDHRAVVCGIHQGMLEETFARLGGSVAVERLEPFASEQPLVCTVALRSGPDPGPSTTRAAVASERRRRRPGGAPRA